MWLKLLYEKKIWWVTYLQENKWKIDDIRWIRYYNESQKKMRYNKDAIIRALL